MKTSEMPENVVPMNSCVRVKDLDRNDEVIYQIVFPGEANSGKNRISVLAPIGTGLLGYREGDIVEWAVPSGVRRLRIVSVNREPEVVAGGSGLTFRNASRLDKSRDPLPSP